jgi:hypothetical protein
VGATLRYTLLGFGVVSLMDQGEGLPMDDAHKHVEDRSLFTWLKQQFGDHLDLSLYQDANRAEVLERFASPSNAADSCRKFGVGHDGLALLAAYCFEALQETHYSGQ